MDCRLWAGRAGSLVAAKLRPACCFLQHTLEGGAGKQTRQHNFGSPSGIWLPCFWSGLFVDRETLTFLWVWCWWSASQQECEFTWEVDLAAVSVCGRETENNPDGCCEKNTQADTFKGDLGRPKFWGFQLSWMWDWVPGYLCSKWSGWSPGTGIHALSAPAATRTVSLWSWSSAREVSASSWAATLPQLSLLWCHAVWPRWEHRGQNCNKSNLKFCAYPFLSSSSVKSEASWCLVRLSKLWV